MSDRILMKEFEGLLKEKWVHIELNDDNVREWNIGMFVLSPHSLYYGGYLKAKMTFPENYPYAPPEFRFITHLFHPNIYKDGKVCVSILHSPTGEPHSGELEYEQWSPAQCVESVILSILSLLDDAEVSSAANTDAAILLCENPRAYEKKVRCIAQRSKKDIPQGVIIPPEDFMSKPSVENEQQDFLEEYDLGYETDEEDFDENDEDDDEDTTINNQATETPASPNDTDSDSSDAGVKLVDTQSEPAPAAAEDQYFYSSYSSSSSSSDRNCDHPTCKEIEDVAAYAAEKKAKKADRLSGV